MNKKILLTLLLCMGSIPLANAQVQLPQNLAGAQTVSIQKMPDSTEGFIQLRDELARTPEGGAAMLILAALKYSQDPQQGRHWAIIATDAKMLSPSSADRAYRGFDLGNSANFALQQLDSKKHVPGSYFKGTSAADGYALGAPPYTIHIERSADGGDGNVKVYVVSTGAASPRPITVKKNDAGIWKGTEYSSLFVGVNPPAAKPLGAEDGDF